MIRFGIIGCGHWGPNHVRIFNQPPHAQVVVCADTDEERRKAIQSLYPQVVLTSDYHTILKDSSVEAVVVATPTNTHFAITKEALAAGKHVLCEKPLALDPEECLQLKKLADEKKRVLMIGHIFVFNRGIQCLKQYIQSGELGRIQYAHSERTNLGPFRYDVNALWDLAPHDVSIFNYLFDSCPVNVSARGAKCLGPSLQDLAFASLEYPGNLLVNVHVSWLDPKKVRQITVVGDKKMIVWDDLDNVGPIKLYDKHVERTSKFYATYGDFQLLSREGSITIPNVGFSEPLKEQGQFFISCIQRGESPVIADAGKGYDVVRTLVAVQKSMDNNGSPVEITDHRP